MANKVIIALPCYNEQENIVPLIARFENNFFYMNNLGFSHAYVFVNDGSSDETLQVIEGLQVEKHIVNHSVNQGLGKTMDDALAAATSLASLGDIIITMDSDNSQPPELIFPMVHKILEGNDLVIASRYRYGSRVVGLAKHRELFSIVASFLFRLSYPIRNVRDYTCGFRAYNADVLKRARVFYGQNFIQEQGFQCMAEILIKISKLSQCTICEVPMILRYDLKVGSSKMKVMKTVFKTLELMVKLRFN